MTDKETIRNQQQTIRQLQKRIESLELEARVLREQSKSLQSIIDADFDIINEMNSRYDKLATRWFDLMETPPGTRTTATVTHIDKTARIIPLWKQK